ncbi:LamB/YcsF family protein [Paenibacillus thermotolerans]|uniref:LamB/YcsF family protein n=1 Tax=Paenibacillus thermotolerans TaxID=3027807 RepID=UPI002367B840|nr:MULTISPECIES: 5-oxoprolinase subunit PxpA [unclassified Paenibacillus]
MKRYMDINCDLGESFGVYRLGEDEQILDYVTSANVACGFHAGDPSTMRRTVEACLAKGVAVGAHPGLRDLEGFGRRTMAIGAEEVYELVLYQLGALGAFVRSAGAELRHVKPHGALYHMAESVPGVAEAIVKAAVAYDRTLCVYGMASGRLAASAQSAGLPVVHEAFADRAYASASQLAPRTAPGAVLADASAAAEQAVSIAVKGAVRTIGGREESLKADTLCIHSDSAHALTIARRVHQALLNEGVSLKSLRFD